jgi:hypothetical protein
MAAAERNNSRDSVPLLIVHTGPFVVTRQTRVARRTETHNLKLNLFLPTVWFWLVQWGQGKVRQMRHESVSDDYTEDFATLITNNV